MRPRLLRRRCLRRLRDLAVPRPFDIVALCAGLAQARGRPIRLLPMRLPSAGPHGLWIAGASGDTIVYESATSRPHREHIVMHEVGHMLCDHRVGVAVFAHLDPGVVGAMLARARYSTDEEQEAEMIATLVLERADRSPAPVLAGDPLLARLAAAIDPDGRAADG